MASFKFFFEGLPPAHMKQPNRTGKAVLFNKGRSSFILNPHDFNPKDYPVKLLGEETKAQYSKRTNLYLRQTLKDLARKNKVLKNLMT